MRSLAGDARALGAAGQRKGRKATGLTNPLASSAQRSRCLLATAVLQRGGGLSRCGAHSKASGGATRRRALSHSREETEKTHTHTHTHESGASLAPLSQPCSQPSSQPRPRAARPHHAHTCPPLPSPIHRTPAQRNADAPPTQAAQSAPQAAAQRPAATPAAPSKAKDATLAPPGGQRTRVCLGARRAPHARRWPAACVCD